uniref:Uncharacterized protein LOC106797892 n=1 Tax=Rhizophora mucronata TaxID=61149 RepID=A0A2P2KRD3_RHIMU
MINPFVLWNLMDLNYLRCINLHATMKLMFCVDKDVNCMIILCESFLVMKGEVVLKRN